jgi:uncharacterized protein
MQNDHHVAFAGAKLLGAGSLAEVVATAHPAAKRKQEAVLIFDSASQQVEIDFRGSLDAVLKRLTINAENADSSSVEASERGPGRPRLGVVAREVTLLPRHWHWLNQQNGGASATLRRLVEIASKANAKTDRLRTGREVVYRFATAMAGNAPGFEEAMRALFAGDKKRFASHTVKWPKDVRSHALLLAGNAFE